MHACACRGVKGWRGQLLAGEVQRRRGEPTVTQFTVIPPSATGPQSLGCHHCSYMSIPDHEAHSRQGWLALQNSVFQRYTSGRQKTGSPCFPGGNIKLCWHQGNNVAAPEPVPSENHQTSNCTLGEYPKEWKAGYLSKYRYRNVQSSKAYNSQRWEQVPGGFKQAPGPLGPEIGKLAAYFRPLDDFLSTPGSRKVKL